MLSSIIMLVIIGYTIMAILFFIKLSCLSYNLKQREQKELRTIKSANLKSTIPPAKIAAAVKTAKQTRSKNK